MSNSSSSLYSGKMDEDTKTILIEIMVFLLFGGGLRGAYKWFKESNFTFIIKSRKGKCSFDCKSADAEKPDAPPQVQNVEVEVEEKN